MVCSRVIVAADTHTGALIAAVMVVVVVVIVWRHYHVLCLSACIPNGGLLVPACTPFSPSLPSFLNRLSQCTIRRNVFQRVPLLMVVYVFWKCNSLHTHQTLLLTCTISTHTSTHCRQLSVIHRGHIHTLTGYVTEILGRWPTPPPLPSSPLRAQSGPTLVTQLKLR